MSIKKYIPRPVKEKLKDGLVIVAKSPPSRMINSMRIQSLVKSAGQDVRLHFGCSTRLLSGWINIDLLPAIPMPDVLLDLQKPLPLPDQSVDYIFTEDLIEHLNLENGKALLAECSRILKPGGVIRIGTPDLESFMQAYIQKSQPDLDWYREHLGAQTFAEMFNAGMRAWGHQFLYDEQTLRRVLEQLSFTVYRNTFNQSREKVFHGLDLRDTAEGAHSMYFDCYKAAKGTAAAV